MSKLLKSALTVEVYRGAIEGKHPGCVQLSKEPPFHQLLPSLRLLTM